MRRVRVSGGAPGAFAALLLLGAPADAFAQAEQRIGTWTELPIESSSTVSAVLDSGVSLSGHPRTYKIGADYDFAINGPLLLSLTGTLAFAGEGVGVHAAPGVKYLLPVDANRDGRADLRDLRRTAGGPPPGLRRRPFRLDADRPPAGGRFFSLLRMEWSAHLRRVPRRYAPA